MKVNQRIWVVIVSILVLGTAVTSFTNKYVNNHKSYVVSDTVDDSDSQELYATSDSGGNIKSEADARYSDKTGRMADEAGNQKRRDSGESLEGIRPYMEQPAGDAQPQTAMVPQPEEIPTEQMENLEPASPIPEETAAAMPKISPVDPGTAVLALTDDEETKEELSYMSRLSELDSQIKKMREDTKDPSTSTMKIMVEKERQLWDAELNYVYNIIINQLDEELKSDLIRDEQEWMKERDAKASEAAKKYSGGTLESVEYVVSLTESTRERTYELVSLYLEDEAQNP